MKVEELTEEQRRCLVEEFFLPEDSKAAHNGSSVGIELGYLAMRGLTKRIAMEPFQTIYCLTPAGIALREELLKEEAGNSPED